MLHYRRTAHAYTDAGLAPCLRFLTCQGLAHSPLQSCRQGWYSLPVRRKRATSPSYGLLQPIGKIKHHNLLDRKNTRQRKIILNSNVVLKTTDDVLETLIFSKTVNTVLSFPPRRINFVTSPLISDFSTFQNKIFSSM